MTNESNSRNLDQQIQVGKPKVLKGHTAYIYSVFVKDNLIISGSANKIIRVTPISLFPGELYVFRFVIDSFNLAPHLEREILDYFGERE